MKTPGFFFILVIFAMFAGLGLYVHTMSHENAHAQLCRFDGQEPTIILDIFTNNKIIGGRTICGTTDWEFQRDWLVFQETIGYEMRALIFNLWFMVLFVLLVFYALRENK